MKDSLLEKTKITAFLYKDAALLGTILAKLNFNWNEKIPSACVSGKTLEWNPDWFQSLSLESRVAVLLHELWHIARLHNLRCGSRDKKIWNFACDIRINNDLIADGYRFDEADGLFNEEYDDPRLSEEEIYDRLIKEKKKIPPKAFSDDIVYTQNSEEEQIEIQTVKAAHEYARAVGNQTRGEIEEILHTILKPKIPWQRLLHQFFIDLTNEDYTWKRPNRRYDTMYLPSLNKSEARLTTLNYYIDTSGSITPEILVRFNSELKSIWQDIQPILLRVINFDTKIQEVKEIHDGQPYSMFSFTGRGGTRITPVLEHIKQTKPLAAIIFSDLYCEPPELNPGVPVIWIVVDNPSIKLPFGKVIHISEEITNGN